MMVYAYAGPVMVWHKMHRVNTGKIHVKPLAKRTANHLLNQYVDMVLNHACICMYQLSLSGAIQFDKHQYQGP